MCAAAPGAAIVWAALRVPDVLGGTPAVERLSWAPSLGLSLTLRLDSFALLLVTLIAGVGVLVFVYAYGYFSKPTRSLGRLVAALVAFAGAMLGLVLADNVVLVFVFWELTSITSYLLIGYEDRSRSARDAAQQALLTTSAGGLAMLAGFVVLAQAAGTYSLSGLLEAQPRGPGVGVALVLVLLGAFTKSAQVPFHAWLPGAMAAPTPVSAYLHSATMVKAGVYVIARFAPAFAAVPVWRPMVLTVGVLTMLVGAYRALRQHDLKLLLAFGTVSQLGFLIVLFGAGTADTAFAGTVLLLAHGAFKAALFLVVGAVDKAMGTRDIRRLPSLVPVLPWVTAAGVVSAASMAGLPLVFGFVAKELAFEGLLHGGFGFGAPVVVAGVVVGSMLTFAYSARFVAGMSGRYGAAPAVLSRRPPLAVTAPAVLLAAITLLLGVLPAFAEPLLGAATLALRPEFSPPHLKLWHGVNTALILSAVAVGGGVVLFAARRRVERAQGRIPPVVDASTAYTATVRGVLWAAARVTGVLQNGSLPIYLSVISITVVVLPGWVLLRRVPLPPVPAFAENAMQASVAFLVIIAAFAALLARHRFAAVLFLGAAGYGVALLFVIHGAPDLALTQLLVETLSLVIFVLVLYHLPARFREAERRPLPIYRALQIAVAGAVGVFVLVFALAATAARTATPVSEAQVALALPEAEGRNVVNVILVDFRGLDTLGEITVLVVAAVGILSLVRAARIHPKAPDSLTTREEERAVE